MSDPFFDAARASGEYPRKGYGHLSEDQKREEIQRKLNKGWDEPWVLREAKRMSLKAQVANV